MELFGAIKFLQEHPEMSFGPLRNGELLLKGILRFKAKYKDLPDIEDSYNLEIVVPKNFPFQLPKVTELDKKIPRVHYYHVNLDNTLCVGTPLRVIIKLGRSATINGYVNQLLIPYLYAVSHKLQYGGKFVFGELGHDFVGLYDDYYDVLGLTRPHQVVYALKLLSMQKREANKYTCPCECGKRLVECKFHDKLNRLRKVAPKSYYKQQLFMLI